MRSRSDAMRSMDEGPAESSTDRSGPARRVGGGTAESTGRGREADTARGEHVADGAPRLMEEVVRRENVVAAYKRVVRNGGAPGVD